MSTSADKKSGKISSPVAFVPATFKQPSQPARPIAILPESPVNFKRANVPKRDTIRHHRSLARPTHIELHNIGDILTVKYYGYSDQPSTYEIPACRVAEFESQFLTLVSQFCTVPAESEPVGISLNPDSVAESKVYIPKQEAILNLIFNASEWYEAATLCKLAGFSGSNPSAQPHKWKKAGKVFALRRGATDVYPAYAFGDDFRPIAAMEDVLRVFKEKKSDLKIAAWFASDNSWLRNKRPLDLISSDADSVIKAAETEVMPIDHG